MKAKTNGKVKRVNQRISTKASRFLRAEAKRQGRSIINVVDSLCGV